MKPLPYINHPIEVAISLKQRYPTPESMGLTMEELDPEHQKQCKNTEFLIDSLPGMVQYLYTALIHGALLHDVIEDTEKTQDDLYEVTDLFTIDVVLEVTDDQKLSKLDQRKAQIVNAPKKSTVGKLVKLADKLHNCTCFTNEMPAGPDLWAILVFNRAVVRGLTLPNGSPLITELTELFEKHIPADLDEKEYLEKYYGRYLPQVNPTPV